MRICVLGKRGSIVGWMEGVVMAWRRAGHLVMPAIFRDPRLHPRLERMLFSPRIGEPAAAALLRRVRAFAPDLIVAVDAFSTPLSLLERLRRAPGLPPLFGWVGDLFGDYAAERAPYFDAIGYTDSGLVSLHAERGLRAEAFYLPHAANAALGAGAVPARPRRTDMVFVGNPTPLRLALLRQLRQPVALLGPGWGTLGDSVHEVQLRRVPLAGLGAVYRAHAAVLNIRNETHVLAGLNQRNFDPFLCGAAVVSDRQPDLERCFDPKLEVAVWDEPAEVDAISARLRCEPGWAAAMAERGRRRVLAEHTYAARLETFARLAGVTVASQ
jgi:spore maturation protein CgeB